MINDHCCLLLLRICTYYSIMDGIKLPVQSNFKLTGLGDRCYQIRAV
jgi:hypothetical protein